MIDLYYRTTWTKARRIVKAGFRNQPEVYATCDDRTGVWLTDRTSEPGRGQRGRALVVVRVHLSLTALARYEISGSDQPGRVFALPRDVLDDYGRIQGIDRVGVQPLARH